MSQHQKDQAETTFTGYRMSRTPRKGVLLRDTLARRLITLSGLGSIVAVLAVGLFLVWVVLPLFGSTNLESQTRPRPTPTAEGVQVLTQRLDDYGLLVWSLASDGAFTLQEVASGQVVAPARMVAQDVPTAWSFPASGTLGVLGFADGTLMTVDVDFSVEYLNDPAVPESLRALEPGDHAVHDQGLLYRTSEGQLRHQRLDLKPGERLPAGNGALQLMDLAQPPGQTVVVALDSAGVFHYSEITQRKNLLTGRVTTRTRGSTLDLHVANVDLQTWPQALKLNDAGSEALLIWADGRTHILKRNDQDVFETATEVDLTPKAGVTVTVTTFLAGRSSLAVGDSDGQVVVWFSVNNRDDSGTTLVPAHNVAQGTTPVSALAGSQRSRLLAVAYEGGQLGLHHVTSGRDLGQGQLDGTIAKVLTIAPREDQLLAAGDTGSGLWRINAPYPETSVRTLLQPVWYEGYADQAYVWQSSAAEDSFEPKLSLIPLIYGTLKATIYSLLFGLPLALLAAVYTSEFLPRRTRAKVKPVIEIMASLPSVVLGFLAALVMAPFVEKTIISIFTVIVMGPFVVLLGAHFWQILPREMAVRLESWRPIAVGFALLVGTTIAWSLGPHLEAVGFGGDFKAWLDGRVGGAIGGWFGILLLPCAAVVTWWQSVHGEGLLRQRGPQWSRQRLAVLDLGRFLVSAAFAVGLALFLGWLMDSTGWDPRGSLTGTYVQRNALVVGFAMGFAVIPIIYTISEDALAAVPDHLRAASLGAGATPWQTAIRVVIPPAMGGLFSAAMIGLGRAVGETMIVLMAAGNTPIMDLNLFNGFRTLSANLAVELPEAVQNSTHYRTLFLAALTLFVLTFILNTAAEAVRLHFRRKASRL